MGSRYAILQFHRARRAAAEEARSSTSPACFLVLGGLLVRRWPRVAWIICLAPAGRAVLTGLIWPLTPLKTLLPSGRARLVPAAIAPYVWPVLYHRLPHGEPLVLAVFVIALNVVHPLRGRRPDPAELDSVDMCFAS